MTYQEFLKEHGYITFTYTGPCSYGEHYDAECSCGWKVDVYATGADIVAHVLEVLKKREQA